MIPIPTGDNVVIEPIEREQETKSGILLPFDPNSYEKIPNRGRVLRVGPGRIIESGANVGRHIPMQVKVGDIVYFSKMTGSEIKQGEDRWLIVPERDVLTVEVE